MPLACRFTSENGRDACTSSCPTRAGAFHYRRIEAGDAPPAPEKHRVDVAILAMNHGWPNLGHGSIVHALQEAACDLTSELEASGLALRALSFDVRRGAIPEPPGGRFALYVGTGGPGHLDPRRNDGSSEGSQGIVE